MTEQEYITNIPWADNFDPISTIPDVPSCDRMIRICQSALKARPDMPYMAVEVYSDLVNLATKQKHDLENIVITGELIL